MQKDDLVVKKKQKHRNIQSLQKELLAENEAARHPKDEL
jgi:hypothetical protein